jgi:peptidyl-prolyl cis-trans isomerase A (cyclophilin A)
MARTSDPDSATSQFFINVVDNEGLNYPKPDGHGYAVFGKVVDGMNVVDQIKGVQTGIRDGVRDVPLETVEIIRVTRDTP